ncbi:MAG TPA: hypothetical protein VNW96_14440 [Mycobacterium sp.]|nr:hypothetical protein [Mycobacterium sp.]
MTDHRPSHPTRLAEIAAQRPGIAPADATHGRTIAARCDARRLEGGETVNATGPGSRRVFPTVQATRLFGTGRLDPRSGAPSGAVPS